MDWNKKITLTRKELYDLIHYGLKATPRGNVKSKSSFNTGVMNCFDKIFSNKKLQKLFKETI